MNSLFQVDISSFNVIKLAKWLKKCRSETILNDDGYSSYADRVQTFCVEWKQHAEKYPDTYKSEKYKQAILYLALKSPKYYLQGKDVSNEIILLLEEEESFCNACQSMANREIKRINEYHKHIDIFLGYTHGRKYLEKLINEFKEKTKINTVTLLNDESILFDKTALKETLQRIKRLRMADGNSKIIFETEKTYSEYIINQLRKAQISKNKYYKYIYTAPDDLGKNFFTNLAFFLCLPLNDAQKLYQTEGFSIVDSKRLDDNILCDCFQYGFPREYANALLAKGGFKCLDIDK